MLPRLWLLVGSNRQTDRPTMSLIELSWTAKKTVRKLPEKQNCNYIDKVIYISKDYGFADVIEIYINSYPLDSPLVSQYHLVMVDPIKSMGQQDNLSYLFVSSLLFSLPLKIPSKTCSICPFLFSSTLFSYCGDLQICKWNHSFWQTFSCQTWHYLSACVTTSLLIAIIQQSHFSQFCPFSSPWSITCNRQHRNFGMVGFATDLQSQPSFLKYYPY